MISRGATSVPFPIHFGDIILAEILDPNGRNPKTRPVVVLTPAAELAPGYPIVVAAVTSTLPNPLTSDYVIVPYTNPPGRHPKTGLDRKSAVLCTWVAAIALNDIKGRLGFVPPKDMTNVETETSAKAQLLGGWP